MYKCVRLRCQILGAAAKCRGSNLVAASGRNDAGSRRVKYTRRWALHESGRIRRASPYCYAEIKMATMSPSSCATYTTRDKPFERKKNKKARPRLAFAAVYFPKALVVYPGLCVFMKHQNQNRLSNTMPLSPFWAALHIYGVHRSCIHSYSG